MPFVRGCGASTELRGGVCVDPFSDLTAAPTGEPERALLGGCVASADGSCELDLATPLGARAGRCACWLVCCPLTPAATIRRWRWRASLSTLTPGVGELRC